MKKILLLFLTLISIQAYSQRSGKIEFDFTKPETLHASGNFTVPQNAGEFMLYQNSFTEGQVTLSFSTVGNGLALRSESDGSGSLSYSLAVRGHAEFTISIKGSGYNLSAVEFDGYLGDLSNVNTVSKRWTASSSSETSVSFRNGTQHASIKKIIVEYTRPAEAVILRSSTPAGNGKVESFSEMSLKFNLPMTVVKNDGFTLYELNSDEETVAGSEIPMTATVSSSDENVVVLHVSNKITEDGVYEVVIPSGALQNSDNALNSELRIRFNVETPHNTLLYTSVNPNPDNGSITKIPEILTFTFGQNVKIEDNRNCVLQKADTDTYIELDLESDGHDVNITNREGEIFEPGKWVLKIPEGTISNGNSSPKYYRYNPEITLVYTVENESSILQREASELFTRGGFASALVGYPAEGSKGRDLLKEVVSKGTKAGVDELNEAINTYYSESDVVMPKSDGWYKIAGVCNVDTLYLAYRNGTLSLTRDSLSASAFKAKAFANNDNSFAFMTNDATETYLHIGTQLVDGHNLTTQTILPHFTLTKLSIEGQKIAGLITMEDEQFASMQFTDSLSRGFLLVETSEDANMLKPDARLSASSIEKPGDALTLSISNVGNIKLNDVTKPYYMSGSTRIVYSSNVLTATNDSTLFQVNTRGLTAGTYTLVVPAGTFIYTNSNLSIKDGDLILNFEIRNNSSTTDEPNFNYSYNKYNVMQNLTMNVNNMVSTDLNDIVIFAYLDDYTDLIPNEKKEVSIVKFRSGVIVNTGHFEVYPDSAFQATYHIEGVKAIRLKLDKPFTLGDLKNDPGIYSIVIDAASFGDENYGKYLKDPTSIREEDCIVNSFSSSIRFVIDDANAINTPSSEMLRLVQDLVNTHGVGYPSEGCNSRKALEDKLIRVQGSDDVYRGLINAFYAETSIVMPSNDTYYRVSAVGDGGTTAYLTYDGMKVGVTDDVANATGFKLHVNGDGTFLFQTGDGRYLQQLSALNNILINPTTSNNITLAKLSVNGVDAAKTFGLFSFKADGVFANVDVNEPQILSATSELSNFNTIMTNGFKLEEVDKASITPPTVKTILTPAHGTYVETLSTVTVTFEGISKVDLADIGRISLSSATEENVGKMSVTPVEGKLNEYSITFTDLPESSSYTLWIERGAFTFIFAETTHEIGSVRANFNIGTSGITGISIDALDGPVYDLQGRKIEGKTLKSGIYIKNGKKVYIK